MFYGNSQLATLFTALRAAEAGGVRLERPVLPSTDSVAEAGGDREDENEEGK